MEAFPPHPANPQVPLSDLLHRIYEAALDQAAWPYALDAIVKWLAADGALLFAPFARPPEGGLLATAGFPADLLPAASSFEAHDDWSEPLRLAGMWRHGDVLTECHLNAHEGLLTSRLYHDILGPLGMEHLCLGLILDGTPHSPASVLALIRCERERPFDANDRQWMRLLTAHVSRSLRLSQRLRVTHLLGRSKVAALDQLPFGVALLDADLKVLHLNQPAQIVLDRNDGIQLDANRRLDSSAAARKPRLAQWLAALRDQPHTHRSLTLDVCRVLRRNAPHCYLVQCTAVAPLHTWPEGGSRAVRFVAFITDPAALRLPSITQLMQLFSLTRTQARVALEFARGATYKDVASLLGTAQETVRSHVKEIYPKTRVNRQADLVRLILSLAQSAV